MDDNIRPWGYYENLSDTATHKVKRILCTRGSG